MIESSKSPVGDKVVEAARSYLGCPFHHQGRSRAGIDCVGLIVRSGRDAGFTVHDHTVYPRFPKPAELLHHVGRSFAQVENVFLAKPGDVVLFWIKKPKWPQHAGVLTAEGVVHTWQTVGRVVETPIHDFWADKVHSVWRYKLWQQSHSR